MTSVLGPPVFCILVLQGQLHPGPQAASSRQASPGPGVLGEDLGLRGTQPPSHTAWRTMSRQARQARQTATASRGRAPADSGRWREGTSGMGHSPVQGPSLLRRAAQGRGVARQAGTLQHGGRGEKRARGLDFWQRERLEPDRFLDTQSFARNVEIIFPRCSALWSGLKCTTRLGFHGEELGTTAIGQDSGARAQFPNTVLQSGMCLGWSGRSDRPLERDRLIPTLLSGATVTQRAF